MLKHVMAVMGTLAAAMVFTACSEAPKPAADTKKEQAAPKKEEAPVPSGPVAAKSAFYEMYKPAREWAADLLPLTLTAGDIPGMTNEAGKAARWTAVFVSPARKEARTFFYAVADHGPDTHKGVTSGGTQTWTGETPKSRPFQITQFAIDSDAAYKTAATKAAGWLKGHPGRKPEMVLANSARFPGPVWQVMWGTQKNGYVTWIDATSGVPVKGR